MSPTTMVPTTMDPTTMAHTIMAPTTRDPTEYACMAWPKLTKNANFGPNLVVFGQKILFFTGETKSFVTYITENPPRPLFTLFFGQHWTICAKNADIWPKMPVLGQIWPFLGPKSNFLGAGSKNFGTLVSGFQCDTFFVLKTLISGAQIGR